MKIPSLLKKKGIISSLIGFAIVIPINYVAVYNYIVGIRTLSYDELVTLFGLNAIGVIFIMLPSEVRFKFLQGEFVLKD